MTRNAIKLFNSQILLYNVQNFIILYYPKPSNGFCGIFSFLIKVYKLKPVGLQNQENFRKNFDASIGSKTIIFSEVNTQQVLELKKYVI
ncbi:unnamed protein product [Rhizophagus irregularis]|uniref:Uncharacterized protein n=1 Tax=Rhizophagus irregularis TaxID=588596 RepID=A0A915ZX29_9GLOM|nr:unnamed protein product [Rhizophagus irregularis]